MPPTDPRPTSDRELVISRVIDAPPEKVFTCWRDAKRLQQWFAPRPWTTPVCEVDLRSGGVFRTIMHSEDGREQSGGAGVFLEVVENRRIIFTDALTADWEPGAEKPFMVAIVELEDLGGRTRYTARVRHWSVEDRKAHEQMGFHEGWGKCIAQLEEVARES
jgi:uncharacterized protein YndB with AHSA1/START domain